MESEEIVKAIDDIQCHIIWNGVGGILMKGDVCASVRYRTLYLPPPEWCPR